jgi:putative transposase
VPLRGFRFRFCPTTDQEQLLRRTIGCVRFVQNKALAVRSDAWKTDKKSVGYLATSRLLTEWKKHPDLDFLNEVSCVPLQQALRHLQTAFTNFFKKRAAYPTFKRKGGGGSAEFTRNAFRWDPKAQTLILAKMDKPLIIHWSRPLPPDVVPTTVTVSLDAAGRWHVSLLCEDASIQPLPALESAIGIDVGVTTLATISTGEKISNPRHDEQSMARKKRLSRNLSRKQKGSSNWNKDRLKLARNYARTADRRLDDAHKLSTRLVRENQVIVVEDLSLRNMVRNRKLARVLYDAGLSELIRQLEYKSAWYGRDFLKIDRFHPSSKMCSCCGHVLDQLPLGVRHWTCPACKAEHDRDVNAARNILAAGLAATACGPDVRQRILRSMLLLGMKQERPSVTKGITILLDGEMSSVRVVCGQADE